MAPATWGVAIDVPEMVLTASDPPIHALLMNEPGAKMLTQVP